MLLMLQPEDLRLPSWHCVWVLLKCSARCFRVYEISTPGERQFSKASCKLSLSRMCTLSRKCLLATSFACPKLLNLLFLMQRVFAGAGIGMFLKRRTPWRSACETPSAVLPATPNNRYKLSRQLGDSDEGKNKPKHFNISTRGFHRLSLTSRKL